jgi:hypothetical protein
MARDFAQFEQAYKQKLKIVEVNVDNRDLTEQYRKYKSTGYIPETVIVRQDSVVFQKTGKMSYADLEAAVGQASH